MPTSTSSYDEKYNSAWVTLPNSYYDPVKGHRLYNRYIDELIYADELGFDGVGVNEHHQNAYGLMPIPGVIAGALARQTKRAKIAVLGRALPLVNNPLTIAEEFAMLDNISGGRLIAGFVRGIGAEYHASGVNPAESHGRYQEAHDLIIRAWTETGPVPARGQVLPAQVREHLAAPLPEAASADLDPVAGQPRDHRMGRTPVAKIHLPADLQPGRGAGAVHGDSIASRRRNTAIPPRPSSSAGRCRSTSPTATPAAYREAKPHIESFYNKFARMPQEMLLPPGYLSLPSMQALVAKSKATLTSGVYQTIDDVMRKGIFLCGSADTVCDLLTTYQQKIGFGHLICLLQFGTLPRRPDQAKSRAVRAQGHAAGAPSGRERGRGLRAIAAVGRRTASAGTRLRWALSQRAMPRRGELLSAVGFGVMSARA